MSQLLRGKSLQLMIPTVHQTQNFSSSFQQLLAMLAHANIPHAYNMLTNESAITRGRNRLVDHFLKTTEFTHAMFIDDDIGFNAEDVLMMLEQDKDIIGAACVKKSINWQRILKAIRRHPEREWTNDELQRLGGDFVVNYLQEDEQTDIRFDGNPKEVLHIGNAFMMIKREVFLGYRKAYPDRWYHSPTDPAAMPGKIHEFFRMGIHPETHFYDTEDYCFCADTRAIGFKTYMMPGIRTSHMGHYLYIGDMMTAALAGEI